MMQTDNYKIHYFSNENLKVIEIHFYIWNVYNVI